MRPETKLLQELFSLESNARSSTDRQAKGIINGVEVLIKIDTARRGHFYIANKKMPYWMARNNIFAGESNV